MNRIFLPALVYALTLSLGACEKKGPMEHAGEKLDETARTLKNGGEKTPGDKVKDAAEDVRNGAEKAVNDGK